MEHSGPGRHSTGIPADPGGFVVRAALVVVEAASQLVFPGALLALAGGAAGTAVWVALASLVVAGARGALSGAATERAVVHTWAAVVEVIRRTPVTRLRGVGERIEVAQLAEAARDSATYQALGAPQLGGRLLALVTVGALTAALLEPAWVLLGALGVLAMLAAGRVIQLRMRAAHATSWGAFVHLTEDARVLVDGCLELRAHGCAERFDGRLMGRVEVMARGERSAATWSTISGLVPAALALLTLLAPVRAGASWATNLLGGDLVRVGILGGTAVMTMVGLVRAIELRVRTRISARTLDSLAERALPSTTPGGAVPPALDEVDIVFDAVSFVHEGGTAATPHRFTHRWSTDARGLAITGQNGSGKSTLALLLLGLLRPTDGAIRLGTRTPAELAPALGLRVAYLPQNPLLVADESVRWHLDFLLARPVDEARARAALDRVGLLNVLEQRAARRGTGPLEVPAGALSGGEQQRMHLARVLLHDADLVVLDEPEAGLDEDAREMLRALCAELASARRVLLVAHDEGVIPESFRRVRCSREIGVAVPEGTPSGASQAERALRATG